MLLHGVACSLENLLCSSQVADAVDELCELGVYGPPVLRQTLGKEVGDVLEEKVTGNHYLWVVILHPRNTDNIKL